MMHPLAEEFTRQLKQKLTHQLITRPHDVLFWDHNPPLVCAAFFFKPDRTVYSKFLKSLFRDDLYGRTRSFLFAKICRDPLARGFAENRLEIIADVPGRGLIIATNLVVCREDRKMRKKNRQNILLGEKMKE